MDKLELWIVAKYLGGLKQEIQDQIVNAIWDMGTQKLEERKQNVVFRTQQQFISVQNKPSSVGVKNKHKTWAGSSQAQQP